jgi:cobalt-zinc-cadmium efflux system outer membrane protein
VNRFRTSPLQLTAFALAIVVAAGCATARNDIGATDNARQSIEPAALPADIVRRPAQESRSQSVDQNRPGQNRQSSEIILASGEEELRSPRQGVDMADEKTGAHMLEKRLEVPKELPGADVQRMRLPKNEKSYQVAIQTLFPSVADPPPMNEGPAAGPRPKVSLTELEQMALANSPIVTQFQSDVTGAIGSAIQAGTHPNPIFGYESDTVGSSQTRDYQGVYASQIIKTAGKLQVAQAIENVDLMNAQLLLRQAKNDLLSQVRRQYFALLIARESMKINEAIVRFTYAVYQIQVDQVKLGGQAAVFEPMQLRTFVEQSRATLVAARNRYISAWQQLTATLNAPGLPLADLVDVPELSVPQLDYDAAVSHVLSMNTEIRAARNGPIRARLSLRLAEITPIPDVYAYITVQKDFTTPGLPHASYNTQFGMPIPVWDQNKGNILTARGFLVRATEEIPRVQNDLRTRLADAFERFETNRFQVGVSRDQILPDAVRTYRGTYERHTQEPDTVGFADVVVAQQNMLNAVGVYITALNGQWTAFVDIAGLLQVESLKELSLRIRDEAAAPAAAENRDAQAGVSSMMAQLRLPPKSVTPVAAQEQVADEDQPDFEETSPSESDEE